MKQSIFCFKVLLLLSYFFIATCAPPPNRPRPIPRAEITEISETSQPASSKPTATEINTLLTEVSSSNSPNILLIIADDMGIDASPCYDFGAEKPAMPNLKRLCEQGVVFEQVWATPTCSSTRATLLTGRYGFRTGIGAAIGPNTPSGGIGLNEMSIQRFLKQNAPANYSTAVIGKWHLADQRNGGANNPTMMGIDYYAGLLAGVHQDYSNWQYTENGVTKTVTSYATTTFTDKAITWLAQQQQPWFLWLAYTAPHEPFHLPPAELHQHSELSGAETDIRRNPLPYYLASLESLDYEIGRLLDSLAQDVRKNTIIIFIGDNGTPNRVIQAPFQTNQAKGTIFEGGIHVPLVIAGTGVTRKGEREDALINSTDFFATIAELAGIPNASQSDSISFALLLTQTNNHPRQFAYAEFFGSQDPRQQQNQGWTIRNDRFKLIELDTGNRFFYDLLADPAEQINLLISSLGELEKQQLSLLEEEAVLLRAR